MTDLDRRIRRIIDATEPLVGSEVRHLHDRTASRPDGGRPRHHIVIATLAAVTVVVLGVASAVHDRRGRTEVATVGSSTTTSTRRGVTPGRGKVPLDTGRSTATRGNITVTVAVEPWPRDVEAGAVLQATLTIVNRGPTRHIPTSACGTMQLFQLEVDHVAGGVPLDLCGDAIIRHGADRYTIFGMTGRPGFSTVRLEVVAPALRRLVPIPPPITVLVTSARHRTKTATFPEFGLTLTAPHRIVGTVPAAARTREAVLRSFRHSEGASLVSGAPAGNVPTVERRSAFIAHAYIARGDPGSGRFQAWVVTYPHVPVVSYGPKPFRHESCPFTAVQDVSTGRWVDFFQACG